MSTDSISVHTNYFHYDIKPFFFRFYIIYLSICISKNTRKKIQKAQERERENGAKICELKKEIARKSNFDNKGGEEIIKEKDRLIRLIIEAAAKLAKQVKSAPKEDE